MIPYLLNPKTYLVLTEEYVRLCFDIHEDLIDYLFGIEPLPEDL